jgi:hypothetical protein
MKREKERVEERRIKKKKERESARERERESFFSEWEPRRSQGVVGEQSAVNHLHPCPALFLVNTSVKQTAEQVGAERVLIAATQRRNLVIKQTHSLFASFSPTPIRSSNKIRPK